MALLAYHASHEQFAPSVLKELAIKAEAAGFDAIHSSDHFHPWSERQGESGFSFSWVAAALQATTLPFSMICAPGQRYHPAIAGQAISTLAEMFPGRINFELGSGEALNENITGDPWPPKEVRNERLRECVMIIRKLLNGEEVSFSGHVTVERAKLYTLPDVKPLLLCAAISQQTAAWAGKWADGIITTSESEVSKTLDKIKAFQDAGGAGKPFYIQFAFSYSKDRKAAEDGVYDQWRNNILPREKLASLRTVEDFEEMGANTTRQDVLDAIPVFTDMHLLLEEVRKLEALGAERIILHNINRNHEEFIDDFAIAKTKR